MSTTTVRHSVSIPTLLVFGGSFAMIINATGPCHRNNLKLLFTELVLIVFMVALLTTQHSQNCYTCCYSNHNQQMPRGKMLDR